MASLTKLTTTSSLPNATMASSSPSSSATSISSLFEFFHQLESLKMTPRRGWLRYDIPLPQVESVADHMYRLSMMCMQVQDPQLDKMKCIQLALVHDVAESIVGDITPRCGVSKAEKYALEENAMSQLLALLPAHSAASLSALWTEYEDQRSTEATLVKDMDRLEMLLQALEYERRDPALDLSPFFASVAAAEPADGHGSCFRHPETRAWYTHLLEKRAALWRPRNESM